MRTVLLGMQLLLSKSQLVYVAVMADGGTACFHNSHKSSLIVLFIHFSSPRLARRDVIRSKQFPSRKATLSSFILHKHPFIYCAILKTASFFLFFFFSIVRLINEAGRRDNKQQNYEGGRCRGASEINVVPLRQGQAG